MHFANTDSLQNLTDFLAGEHLKAVFSRGETTEDQILVWLKVMLSAEPQIYLNCAMQDFALLKRYTSDGPPKKPGTYLKLLHGRTPFDQELDDWGCDGPWIGPLKWFHCTYLSTFGLGFAEGEEYLSTFSSTKIPGPIYFFKEMIYYDGIYYGDWEIQTV
jgi:hypothetical protein